MSNTLEQTLNNEILEDAQIVSEEKKNIDIFDFVWNPPHDFSEIPEQSFKVIAKISKEVSISIKDDGKFKIVGPASICNRFNFVRGAAQIDNYEYPDPLNTRAVNTNGKINFFKQCNFKDKKGDVETYWKDSSKCIDCSEGCPCRLFMAGYYKWLALYRPEELERQREEYRCHKDEIDGKILITSSLKSCVLNEGESYPKLSTSLLTKIRDDIDNWKYCLYTDNGEPQVIKHFNNSAVIEFNKTFYSDVLIEWVKKDNSPYRQTLSDTELFYNEDLFPYLFVVDLLKRGLYTNYYNEQLVYEENHKPIYSGNSFFGCVTGNDRTEVYNKANELCENIRLSFTSIKTSYYTHITAMDFAQLLSIPDKNYAEYRPIKYKHILSNTIYLITGLKEFVKVYQNCKEDRWISTRQCKHLLKELSPFVKNRFIVLVGEKQEVDDFLALVPSFELIFKRNTISIPDMNSAEIYELYKKELGENNIILNEFEQKLFEEYITYNMSAFSLKNSSLAHFLAEISIKKGKFCLPEDISGFKKANFMEELDKLIGMESIKKSVKDFYNYARYSKALKEQGVNVKAANMHMLFTGNPGTGKTTVARIIARALYDIGIIKENKLIEVSREDLVGQYLGQTAPKTKEVVDKAMNGVLFIDEAYSLYETGYSGGDAYGSEAIATLIKAMEDNKDSLIVIFAGYKKEMTDFLEANSGIKSRIGYTFHFEDYSEDELKEMYYSLIKRTGLFFSEDSKYDVDKKLYDVIKYFHKVKNLGNGRFIDKLYQYTLQKRSERSDTNILMLTDEDIPDIKQLIDYMPDNNSMVIPDDIAENDIKRVTYHELGHAVIGLSLDSSLIIKRITIEASANGALGYVEYDNQNHGLTTATDYKNRICRLMAGLASEEVFCGERSNGGGSDLPKATDIAKHMILRCGMGERGFATRKEADESQYIDEVNELLSCEYERAKKIITEKTDIITDLFKILQDKKTIDKEELERIIFKF